MRVLLRTLPIFLLMGLCTASLAQSNGSSNAPTNAVDAVDAPQNNAPSNGNSAVGANISTAGGSQGQNATGSSAPLTQEQIDNINQSITLLQDQLQQINDPNDPKAIKLQTTIDRLQALLNQ